MTKRLGNMRLVFCNSFHLQQRTTGKGPHRKSLLESQRTNQQRYSPLRSFDEEHLTSQPFDEEHLTSQRAEEISSVQRSVYSQLMAMHYFLSLFECSHRHASRVRQYSGLEAEPSVSSKQQYHSSDHRPRFKRDETMVGFKSFFRSFFSLTILISLPPANTPQFLRMKVLSGVRLLNSSCVIFQIGSVYPKSRTSPITSFDFAAAAGSMFHFRRCFVLRSLRFTCSCPLCRF